MMRGSEEWPATAAHPPEGEEEEEWCEVPPAQDAMERCMALLSEVQRAQMAPEDAALVSQAMYFARQHSRHLYGERRGAA